MIQDNNAKWQVKKLTGIEATNNALHVGYIYQTINPNVQLGSLPLFGGEYDRTVYADLWGWVQEQPNFLVSEEEWQEIAAANGGNVPKFSTGNGSTTFRVPSAKCWVKGASGVEEVGSYLEAGLPNATGFTKGALGADQGYSGAIYTQQSADQNGKYSISGTSYNKTDILLDLSKGNSIYGNSDTVQPPSIVGMWCIVAYNTISHIGNADAYQLMQAIHTKLDNFIDSNGHMVFPDGTKFWLE